VPSEDGKAIFAIGRDSRTELFAWNPKAGEFFNHLHGLSAHWVTYSPDGEQIAYADYPNGNLWRSNADGSEPRRLTFAPMEVLGLSWSPDEKRIAFRARKTPASHFKIYLIDALGGAPEEMLPNDDREEGIPTWSPDGRQIVFGQVPVYVGSGTGTEVIYLCDLATRRVSTVPGSEGLWSSRYSPDGRYIAAVSVDLTQTLELYDTKTRAWRNLGASHVESPVWSHDGKHIYYFSRSHFISGPILRVRVSDGKTEEAAAMGNLRRIGDGWVGLTPDDSPMILRDAGTQEIYRLDVDW
jgi:Tol biopolymer transport system component